MKKKSLQTAHYHIWKKDAYALKTFHTVVFPPGVFLSFLLAKFLCKVFRSQWNVPMDSFWPRELVLSPMTLTYYLYLDLLPLYIHAKIKVCLFVGTVVRVRQIDRQTDTHTDRWCQNYYIYQEFSYNCLKCRNIHDIFGCFTDPELSINLELPYI